MAYTIQKYHGQGMTHRVAAALASLISLCTTLEPVLLLQALLWPTASTLQAVIARHRPTTSSMMPASSSMLHPSVATWHCGRCRHRALRHHQITTPSASSVCDDGGPLHLSRDRPFVQLFRACTGKSSCADYGHTLHPMLCATTMHRARCVRCTACKTQARGRPAPCSDYWWRCFW